MKMTEKWKTECQHVWMALRLQVPTCAKCGVSKILHDTKEYQESREKWGGIK